ncbi:MAG: ABC transporter ATP-binding protein [Phycisphaerales bacterium]
MSSDPGAAPAISVRGVGKCYEIFHSPTQRLRQAVTGRKCGRDFWALQDVTFDVMPGESLGIIGRNGSGKSTLMQIIAGTLAPTTGEVHIRGRVAALLELGSGFNPHFTGRENVMLSGSIMGVPRRKMEEKLPEIEEFAEIGEFLDEPVSVYSSGMHARLAFAVSVSLEPDILILDEILSVGDAGFQQRCIGRLHQLLGRGVTLLFVSHSADAMKSICRHGLLLVKGRQAFFGRAPEAVDRYFATMRTEQSARTVQMYEALAAERKEAARATDAATAPPQVAPPQPSPAPSVAAHLGELSDPGVDPEEAEFALESPEAPGATEAFNGRYGTGDARFESVRLLDAGDRPREGFAFGETVVVEAVFRAERPVPKADVVMRIRDRTGVYLFGAAVNEESRARPMRDLRPGQVIRLRLSFVNNLRAGPHGVTLTLLRPPDRRHKGSGFVTLDHIDAAAAFQALPRRGGVVRGKYQQSTTVEWTVLDTASAER